ncbi:unnamed protein product, partial [Laminaria digitata]
LLVRGGGRAVLNDSYVYWNGGPGVRVEPLAVLSLEHNDCSHNKGGPMQSDGVVRVSRRNCCVLSKRDAGAPLPEGFRAQEQAAGHAPYYEGRGDESVHDSNDNDNDIANTNAKTKTNTNVNGNDDANIYDNGNHNG